MAQRVIVIDYLHVPTGAHAQEVMTTEETPEGGPELYVWEDGNYACDCNRALLFAWARGEEAPVEHPCGDTAYVVRITDGQTGRVLYQENGWKATYKEEAPWPHDQER